MKPILALLAACAVLLAACGPAQVATQGAKAAPTATRAAKPVQHHASRPTAAPTAMPSPTRSAATATSTAPPPPTATVIVTATQPAVSTPTATAAITRGVPSPSAPVVKPAAAIHTSAPQTPQSWLDHNTLLTIYGRAFGTAPILGRLGMDNTFADVDWQIQPFAQGIKANNGGKDTKITIHLIYAMAVPCSATGNCLYYLDDAGVDIVKDYIEPAARRHWLVVLDDQLGRSDPFTEVQRIIAKGYLRYDNVEVALDPEFRATADQPTPGIPIGSVTAEELNHAQADINAYCVHQRLPHRKVMMVHQFRWDMIQDRPALRSDFPYVDPVVIADGFGPPGLKAHIYSELLGPHASAGVRWRGIKLFYPNPLENAGHGDYPLMTWPQVFGLVPAVDDETDGLPYRVRPQPNVIVIA